jgi:hypothetical protein
VRYYTGSVRKSLYQSPGGLRGERCYSLNVRVHKEVQYQFVSSNPILFHQGVVICGDLNTYCLDPLRRANFRFFLTDPTEMFTTHRLGMETDSISEAL